MLGGGESKAIWTFSKKNINFWGTNSRLFENFFVKTKGKDFVVRHKNFSDTQKFPVGGPVCPLGFSACHENDQKHTNTITF